MCSVATVRVGGHRTARGRQRSDTKPFVFFLSLFFPQWATKHSKSWCWVKVGPKTKRREANFLSLSLFLSLFFLSLFYILYILYSLFSILYSNCHSHFVFLFNELFFSFFFLSLSHTPGCVGKTSLTIRYCQDKFNASHITTIQASFLVKRLNVDAQRCQLNIWDTAGQVSRTLDS
jgi:hypothetical protein